MRRLIFACVAVLALGTAGSHLSEAAAMSNKPNGNTPGVSYVSESQVEPIEHQPKSAGIHKGAVEGGTGAQTMHEARSRKFHQQKGVGPKGVRYDFNLGRR